MSESLGANRQLHDGEKSGLNVLMQAFTCLVGLYFVTLNKVELIGLPFWDRGDWLLGSVMLPVQNIINFVS